jgi:acetyltransferase, GNAT family|nr:MAG TPA: acetyltransferase domain containing protein [Caudoviricetes sp.]
MLDDLFVEKSASFQLIEIDNTKEASVDGKWKDPGAALYVQLLNAMYMAPDNESDVNDPRNKYTPDYLKETYLIAPINKIKYGPHGMTPFSRSGCKYPHHVIQNGKLVIHIQGLKAAYARAKQMGIFSGELKEHLERHYKELGLYEGSKMQLDESMNQNFQDIENYIGEETGIDLYSTKDLFEERSHGKLNHSFRYGMNVENGHKIKVVFDLEKMMHKYKQRLESVEYTVSQIDGEIRVPTREDYLNPEFVKWLLFKTEEFEDDEPETFDFSVFETNPTIRNYVYGYFIDNIMRGIIRIKGIKPCIVDMLFVDPSFHRKHIGTILLQHAIDKFGKYDMTIYPFTDNIPAINLYKKLGFVIDSTIDSSPDYYSERNKNKKLYKMIRKSVELKPDPNIIQESFQWMDHFFEQMEDIENFEIRMIDEKDYTNPKFLEWLYKLDEFQPEEQELIFDMLHASTTHGNYVYGYFINDIMRGFIRIRYKDTFNAYAISLLFVDPSFHNLGIGSKLLQFVIDQFGNKDIVLNVFTDNSIAIHIYKKFGFIIEETIDCSNEPECPEEFKDRQQYRMRRIGTNQINLRESKFFESEEASPPPTPTEEKKSDNETNDETNKSDTVEDKPSEEENSFNEEDTPEEPKEESYPKKIDRAEEDKNGVRRKKLYIAFIEWAKEYNPKNIFGSIFDKDVFQTVYPFVPQKMRYFYRLANPMLCVLSGNLTFFAAGELKKLNAKNSKLNEFMIFAATDNDLRVYNNADDKIYRAVEENGMIKLDVAIADTFDIYIQNMINQGDILNGPVDENKG